MSHFKSPSSGQKWPFLTSFSSIRINYRLKMIIWYNGNGASNRSEKNSRFRKKFESVGWCQNGSIDEIISAYSDIFEYFQYLFNFILNHSDSNRIVQSPSKFFNTVIWFRSKGRFVKYHVSFFRSPNQGSPDRNRLDPLLNHQIWSF